ncbi:MAG: arginine--tRNA ligase [Candidatus Odinarchaeia archaeon]
MDRPWEAFAKEAATILSKCLASENIVLEYDDIRKTLSEPPDPKFGDLSSTICFTLAKKLKSSPLHIAKNLVDKIKLTSDSLIEKVEAANPGYINFYLNWSNFNKIVLNSIVEKGENYGALSIGAGRKVVVEHTSPNPTKPIHLGTLRCAVLGDIISRVLRYAGYNVEVQNYMDDLGRQVAVLTWGYLNIAEKVPRKEEYKDDFWLGLIYTKSAQMLEEKPELEEEIREILKKMEEGNNEIASVAEKLVKKAAVGQLKTVWRMNIFYDLVVWEKDIVRSGLFKEAINKMMSTGKVFKIKEGEDAGCIVIDMADFEDVFKTMKKTYKILVRSDGVSTYTGKDIAFQMWKFGLAEADLKFKVLEKQPNGEDLWETDSNGEHLERFGRANKVINVVGYEQKFPQQVVYYALKAMGYEEAFRNSYHMAFKWVWLPEQVAFSGRKGTWIGFHADAALDKAVELAFKEVDKRNPDESEETKRKLAEKIGVGAVKYYIGKFNAEKKIVINWEDVLNFEGDAAPYIQYAYVRTKGILEKVEKEVDPINYALLIDETEKKLIKHLAKFPENVKECAETYQCHLIPQYAFNLATLFNEFYHKLPVIKAESEELKNARLRLVRCTAQVIKNCLEKLMGIEIPEKM